MYLILNKKSDFQFNTIYHSMGPTIPSEFNAYFTADKHLVAEALKLKAQVFKLDALQEIKRMDVNYTEFEDL